MALPTKQYCRSREIPRGVTYNLKSELEGVSTTSGSSIYIDAKNVVTNKRVLYRIDRTSFAVGFVQTMNYTGEYYIGTSSVNQVRDFYIFSMDPTGTFMNVDRYDETATGFPALTATSPVNFIIPGYSIHDIFSYGTDGPPYQIAKVIDNGFAGVILDAITQPAGAIGPFELVIDLSGFPQRVENNAADPESSEAAVTIYPNPSSAQITVDLRNTGTAKMIEIFNADGKIVASYYNVKDKIVLENSLLPGIYFLRLTPEKGEIITRKFIKTD